MSSARNFITKLAIIVLALILADQLIGRLLTHAFARITDHEIGRTNYSFDSTTAPVLVLGASQASSNYVTRILTDSLHLACYDAGHNYQDILYPLALAAATFQRYHPQKLILDLKPNAFVTAQADLANIGVLLPYYHTHPAIQPIVDKRSRWERWETLSFLYCYKSLAPEIIAHYIDDTEKDSVSEQGYLPRFETLSAPPPIPYPEDQLSRTPDTTLLIAFQNIISLVQQNHCRLIVVVSPVYYPLQHGSSTIRVAAEICRTKHVTFLDYSNAPGYAKENSLFWNGSHLSDSGARKFTRSLSADLHNCE